MDDILHHQKQRETKDIRTSITEGAVELLPALETEDSITYQTSSEEYDLIGEFMANIEASKNVDVMHQL